MPLKKRKVATHANATLVHSIPANSARVATSTGPRATAWTPARTRTARPRTAPPTATAAPPAPIRIRLRIGRRGGRRRVASRWIRTPIPSPLRAGPTRLPWRGCGGRGSRGGLALALGRARFPGRPRAAAAPPPPPAAAVLVTPPGGAPLPPHPLPGKLGGGGGA